MSSERRSWRFPLASMTIKSTHSPKPWIERFFTVRPCKYMVSQACIRLCRPHRVPAPGLSQSAFDKKATGLLPDSKHACGQGVEKSFASSPDRLAGGGPGWWSTAITALFRHSSPASLSATSRFIGQFSFNQAADKRTVSIGATEQLRCKRGGPLDYGSVALAITETTRMTVGVPIGPHLFRNAAGNERRAPRIRFNASCGGDNVTLPVAFGSDRTKQLSKDSLAIPALSSGAGRLIAPQCREPSWVISPRSSLIISKTYDWRTIV